LFSIETLPIIPNQTIWDKKEMSTNMDIIHYGKDYFGLPIGVSLTGISALPFRAHNMIYNDWFRDENLQDSLNVPVDDGPNLS
jgi:hypothetical protein